MTALPIGRRCSRTSTSIVRTDVRNPGSGCSGFQETAMGPGGERGLKLIAADNPAPRRAYAFRRLPSSAGSHSLIGQDSALGLGSAP